METRTGLQDVFLNEARRGRVPLTVFLTNGFQQRGTIIAYDGYNRKGSEGSIEEIGPVTVVYTRERQTADAYIERTTYEISDEHSVRVVTSDYQEQLVILGSGGLRVSAREFYAEILDNLKLIREKIESYIK